MNNNDCFWEFQQDDFTWQKFDDQTSKILNDAHEKKQDICFFELKSELYEVHLAKKEQMNLHTRCFRHIRSSRDAAADDIQSCYKQVNFQTIQEENKDCIICMQPMKQNEKIIQLVNCDKHYFHLTCPAINVSVLDWVEEKKACPTCKKTYGIQSGNCPPGRMYISTCSSLPGYEQCAGLSISFLFGDGVQGPSHPHPNQPYYGERRVAYLPDNKEGQDVLQLFKKAWKYGLLFTIGYSLTRNIDDVIIYNGIHMKTEQKGPYGYPDDTYLQRVTDELKQKGIVLE